MRRGKKGWFNNWGFPFLLAFYFFSWWWNRGYKDASENREVVQKYCGAGRWLLVMLGQQNWPQKGGKAECICKEYWQTVLGLIEDPFAWVALIWSMEFAAILMLLWSYNLPSSQLVGSLQHKGLPIPYAILSALKEALSLFIHSWEVPNSN